MGKIYIIEVVEKEEKEVVNLSDADVVGEKIFVPENFAQLTIAGGVVEVYNDE